jgi:hypothetical protein
VDSLSLPMLPLLSFDFSLLSLSPVLIMIKAISRLTCLFHFAQQQLSTLQILPVDSIVTVDVVDGDATEAKLRSEIT